MGKCSWYGLQKNMLTVSLLMVRLFLAAIAPP